MPNENVLVYNASVASKFFYSKVFPEGEKVMVDSKDYEHVATAGMAALAFSDPRRMEKIRILMESNPFDEDEMMVFNCDASKIVKKMCEKYELGKNVFTQEEIRMAGAVCEFAVDHIEFLECIKEKKEKYHKWLKSLKPYQRKAVKAVNKNEQSILDNFREE